MRRSLTWGSWTARVGAALVGGITAVAGVGAPTAAAQQPPSTAAMAPWRTLQAQRITIAPPRIDGRLDDAAWATAPVATGFTQYRPEPGQPASQQTDARVLYDDDALYVGLRAYETEPDAIAGQLTRRDEDSYSDWLGVMIDSNADRRTAYQFGVNPRGVRRDLRRIADTDEDPTWDPVWEAAVHVDGTGWTAELRIPFSQLRFGAAAEQRWGLNFFRVIARRDEVDLWAPTGPDDGAVVSRFGWLEAVRDLPASRRVELLPYALARVQDGPAHAPARQTLGGVGLDLKAGLAGDLTLDLTVNPDYGQVEADPARVNLTAFETLVPERRPFFLEASELFSVPISFSSDADERETLFYSRRIGRRPHGGLGDVRFSSPATETTILAAAKLSGRTTGGWALGALGAVTAEETATVDGAGGPEGVVVEPRTSYSVVRVERELRQNRSSVGLVGTVVRRDRSADPRLQLPRGAYAGGVDFRHRFAADRYQLTGFVFGSHLTGSTQALDAVQRSPVHYFQRPDATHLDYDPERRTLTGATARFRIDRLAGGPWRGAAGYQMRTPGFDVNDLGYQRYADYHLAFAEVGYERNEQRGALRSWRLYSTAWGTTTQGGERIELAGNVRGEARLPNLWSGWVGVEHDRGGFSPWELRGGPLLRREPETQIWAGLRSDGRRRLQAEIRGYAVVRPTSDSRATETALYLTWRPAARLQIAGGPRYVHRAEDQQWLGATSGDPARYIFGRLEQRTLALTTRAELAFTPSLTLQLYAQPFVSAGRVTRFRRVADARAADPAARFEAIDVVPVGPGEYEGDLDADGTTDRFADPDFGYRQFRSNVVMRWEFRPGSTLYLAWSQGRTQQTGVGAFDPWRDTRSLFSARPEDALMVKVSYWMSQ